MTTDAESRITVGVDIGGTKILGVAVDAAAPDKVLAEQRVDTPRGAPRVLDAVDKMISSLGQRPELHGRAIRAVGVGIAGLVDRNGVLYMGPHLPTFRKEPVQSNLQLRLGLPVAVDNDATCAAWAEHRTGAARSVDDSVCVALGTGIGAGIVAGGQVLRGAHGFAGEAGHMMVDPTGPVCPCGRRGCWERLGSGSGLGRLAREEAEADRLDRALELAGGQVAALQGEHVTRAAREGDAQALALLRRFGWWVAVGLSNLVTLLDPQMVVIAGGLTEIGEPLMEPVRDHFDGLVMAPGARPDTRIVAAELGERAGAIGAALLAP
jgi:glucokinase